MAPRIQPTTPEQLTGVPANEGVVAFTVGRLTPTRAAISALGTPSAASNTILARCANPARIPLARVQARSC